MRIPTHGYFKFPENGDKGATLTDIIQAADYISHAIMTNPEFANGTRNLKGIGLITEKDKRLQTTDKFNEWWTKKARTEKQNQAESSVNL